MKKLIQNKLIKKRLRFFQRTNRGTHFRMNDPSKPENWGSQKNFLKRFSDDKKYKEYIAEMKIYENINNYL